MNIKTLFTKHSEENAPQAVPEEENDDAKLKGFVEETVRELTEMEASGLLMRKPEEYIGAEGFVELISEFPVKAAVRIFDAESKLAEAMEDGRQSAIADISKTKQIPRPIRGSQPAMAQTDYSKMSTEEFNKLKKKFSGR